MEELVHLSQFLTPEDKKVLLVPLIKAGIHDKDDDDRRQISVLLIDALAPSLGQDIVRD